MARVDTQYLDAALKKSEESADALLRNLEVEQNQKEARSNAIEQTGAGKAAFWTGLGYGAKYGVIVISAGCFLVLAGIGCSYAIEALKKPYSAVSIASITPLAEKVSEIQVAARELQGDITEQNLGIKNKLITLENDFAAFEKSLASIGASDSTILDLKVSVDKISQEIANLNQQLVKLEASMVNSKNIEVSETVAVPVENSSLKSSKIHVEKNASSKLCPSNISFEKSCEGKHTFSDGRVYTGYWRSGKPDGEGQLTLTDGSTILGTWENGILSSSKLEANQKIKPLKSVVYFNSVEAKFINPKFDQIVAGHNFASSEQSIWSDAYCYLRVIDSAGTVQINLATFPSPDAKVENHNFKSNQRKHLTRSEFKKAQSACPFKRAGFK